MRSSVYFAASCISLIFLTQNMTSILACLCTAGVGVGVPPYLALLWSSYFLFRGISTIWVEENS